MGRDDGLLGAFEEQVLLGVAHLAADAYGMTVRRFIEERTGRETSIGAVYATLERLERKGWIATHLESEREIVGRFKTMKLDKYLGPDALIAAFEQSQKEQYALEEKQAQARLEAAEDATAAANLAAVEARLGQ